MKKLLASLLFCFSLTFQAQVKILSWNLENFGSSKTDSTLTYIADVIKPYDIAAIQEVVAGTGGPQAIAKLADELNRKGAQWDYVVSDPTSGSTYKTERYAFLYKVSKVKMIGTTWLEQKYGLQIDREPYYATFEFQSKQFTLANFHAITQKRQPETEIKYFKFLPQEYGELNLVFIGDFNCPQSHTVFNPLKAMGYLSVFQGQKTSLKKECQNGNCLASEFDNIYYDIKKMTFTNQQAIHFYKDFTDLHVAKKISDHIPITAELTLN